MSSSERSAGRETARRSKAEPKPTLRRPVRAELVWDGKYDADGRRAAPLRVALPFQTVETVNESAQDRQRAFSFGPGFREEEWRNRLNLGRQEIRAAVAAGGVRRQGQSYLHRSAIRHWRRFFIGVPLQDLWDDIKMIRGIHTGSEALGYATQKPKALLERTVELSSNENDLVFDCFVGSGTTAAVAERLNRRWIGCDLGRFAIHTTRKRLLSISNIRPFVVQNLGKYERQQWVGAEFGKGGSQTAARQRAYIDFIVKLANATPLDGYAWLHGVRGRTHGSCRSCRRAGQRRRRHQIAAEYRRAIGTGKDAPKTSGVDVLGWDFAFELNEVAKQQAAAANIQMRFLRIPRDVMDKRAVEQGDIRSFELAALSVDVTTQKRNVWLKLKDFTIPPDDVPEEARRAVKHWSQWIDHWAVDWDNKSDTFHNEWQTYRTRKDNALALEITHAYADAGEYTIVVKVIDILGNDTTKTLRVRVT
jgi:adenine-specific DNA-methyltransferase